MAEWEDGWNKKLLYFRDGSVVLGQSLWWLVTGQPWALPNKWITSTRMLLLADVCADIQWKDNCGLLQLGSYFRTHFIRTSFLLLLITFYLSKQLLTSGDTVTLLWQSWTEQGKTNQGQKKLCIGSLAKISKLILRCEASTRVNRWAFSGWETLWRCFKKFPHQHIFSLSNRFKRLQNIYSNKICLLIATRLLLLALRTAQ